MDDQLPHAHPDTLLVELVARAIAVAQCEPDAAGHRLCGTTCMWADEPARALVSAGGWHDEAQAAINTVREHDMQTRILREHLLAAADLLAGGSPALPTFADHLRQLAAGSGG